MLPVQGTQIYSCSEKEMTIRIENWSIVSDMANLSMYTAPELRRYRLHGRVHGHPDFRNGQSVVTSAIVDSVDGKVRTESGSLYELGDPSLAYEAEFPGCKERVLKALERRIDGDY